MPSLIRLMRAHDVFMRPMETSLIIDVNLWQRAHTATLQYQIFADLFPLKDKIIWMIYVNFGTYTHTRDITHSC